MGTHPIPQASDAQPDWQSKALVDLATSRSVHLKIQRLLLVEYRGGPWTFATDGFAFIAVKGVVVSFMDECYPQTDLSEPEIFSALRVADLMPARSHRSSVEELLQFCWEYVPDLKDGEVCPRCSGFQRLQCPECHGVASYHCDECGGDGTVDCNCVPGLRVPAVIDGWVFNLKLLLRVLKAASGPCGYWAGPYSTVGATNIPRLNLKGDDWLASVAAIGIEPCSWMPVFRPEGGSAA